MRKFILTLLLLLTLSVIYSQVKRSENLIAVSGKKYYIHRVEPKQTMYSISKAYAVSINQILELNKKKTTDLDEGELLKIPYAEPATVIQNLKYKHYIVKRGDTLYSLARKFGTTKEELIRLNAGVDVALVKGRRLIVPIVTQNQPRYDNMYYYHIVQPKETLSKISRRYNINLRKLKQINNNLKPNRLKPNDEVRIPIANARAEAAKIGMINNKTNGQNEVLVVNDGYRRKKGPLTQIPENWIPKSKDVIIDTNDIPYSVDEPADYIAEFKNEYDMVLMLPIKISSNWMRNYYRGMLLAIQHNDNVPVTISVYDSGKSASTVESKIRKHRNVDFIVGPYYNQAFRAVVPLANPQTTIVSLLSKNNTVYSNPYTLQLNTTDNSINHKIAEYVIYKHLNDNIIYFNGNSFVKYREMVGSDKVKDLNELINSVQDKGSGINREYHEELTRLIDETKKNIIIVPESDHKVIQTLVNSLNVFSMHDIEVIGYYKWKLLPNIDPEMLFNLNFTYFTPFHYLASEQESFTNSYKERFLAFPDDFSYMGYETMSKLLKGIKADGKYFYKKPLHKIIKHKDGGYENIDLYKVQLTKHRDILTD